MIPFLFIVIGVPVGVVIYSCIRYFNSFQNMPDGEMNIVHVCLCGPEYLNKHFTKDVLRKMHISMYGYIPSKDLSKQNLCLRCYLLACRKHDEVLSAVKD